MKTFLSIASVVVTLAVQAIVGAIRESSPLEQGE